MTRGEFNYVATFTYNDAAQTGIYTLSLHDALPICELHGERRTAELSAAEAAGAPAAPPAAALGLAVGGAAGRPGLPGLVARSAAVHVHAGCDRGEQHETHDCLFHTLNNDHPLRSGAAGRSSLAHLDD